jgi:divalent metal cation (Fe/Co/Zn/Cd) transporter
VAVTLFFSLTGVIHVEHSVPGIVITALSVVVLPFLSWFERRAGRELGSASAVADSNHPHRRRGRVPR